MRVERLHSSVVRVLRGEETSWREEGLVMGEKFKGRGWDLVNWRKIGNLMRREKLRWVRNYIRDRWGMKKSRLKIIVRIIRES